MPFQWCSVLVLLQQLVALQPTASQGRPASAASSAATIPGVPTADTDWIRWVTVAVWPDNDLPAWLLEDRSHEMLLRELDPDVIDWAHGLAADRAEFMRSRGVAVSTDSAEEYDQCWPPAQERANWTFDTFRDQGIEQDENGELKFDGLWGAFHMEHHAPLWHETQHAGFSRRVTLADAVSHDNIGNQYTFVPHWSDWTCRKFVEWCRAQNKTLAAGFNSTSGVRQRLKALRTAKNASAIPLDSVLHEYMRFEMTVGTEKWGDLVSEAKRAAVAASRPEVSVWGNQGCIWQQGQPRHNVDGLTFSSPYARPGSLVVSQRSDLVWSELSGPEAGTLNDSASFSFKLNEAAGSRPNGHQIGSWIARYPTSEVTCAVAVAEGSANAGVMTSTLGSIHDATKGHGSPRAGEAYPIHPDGNESGIPGNGAGTGCWRAYSRHNLFVQSQPWLFTDRTRLVDAVVVYSLPTVAWRSFSTVTQYMRADLGDQSPNDAARAQSWVNETELGRHYSGIAWTADLFDRHHIMYGAQIFGHPDMFPDQPSLSRLVRADVLVLPWVDAVTNEQAAHVSGWVRNGGGHLILLGRNETAGSLNEELQPRQQPAWRSLQLDPGNGKVSVVSAADVNAAARSSSADEEEEAKLVGKIGLPTAPLIRTNATDDVFITHFSHGNHAAGNKTMVSTHLVRYAQSVNETGAPIRLSVRDVPTSCSEAVFFSAEANHAAGTPLNFSRVAAYTTIVVPRFAVYGIVAFMSPHERSVRTQAALARRTLNRVTIASRGYGQDPSSVAILRADTVALLAKVQGDTSTSGSTDEDYRRLEPLLNASLQSLTAHLAGLTRGVHQTINHSMAAPFEVEAVRRFSFGRGYEEMPPKPGWLTASGATRWDKSVGFGFTQNGSWIYARDNDDHNGRGNPSADFLHESSLVSNETAVFRIGGLAPSHSYLVTVITGNVEHYSETAHTAVLGPDGSGFLADKTAAGYWQHRALAVNSSAEGIIDLRFGSNNTGALYQTADNPLYDSNTALSPSGQGPGASFVSWMVAGLLVQTLDQAPTLQAAAQLLENTALAKGALRNWTVAGPIYDPEKRGLTKQWPVELEPNRSSYPGIGWGGSAVTWRPLAALTATGAMIELSLASIFEPSQLNSSIAYAKTTVASSATTVRRVKLVYSASQATTVFLNGVAVDSKMTAAGCMKRDGLVEVTLPAGESEIMLKMSCHWGRAWGFWAGLYEPGDLWR